MSSKKSRTVDLGGGDYSPFENNSYMCVINHTFTDADETSADRQTSYGGNQNWFEDDNGHWFPQDVNGYVNYNFDAYIDPHGCGLIAYNDVSEDRLHYYSLQDEAISDIEFANSGYFFIHKRNAQGHYFTVTGIIYDYQAEEVYLRVSNAGREQYIIFSEYVSYVENHGVVFSSTVNPGNAIIYFEE